MKEPINTTTGDCAYALTTRYASMCAANMMFGGGHYPMTAVLECERPSIVSLTPWNNPRGDMGDITPAITASAWCDNNYVKLPNADNNASSMVGYQITKGGNIRGYNANRKDKSGRMSEQYSNTDGVAQTLTIQHQKIYTMEQKFRIRKLTPRECYRLMDVSEENIDKLLATDISMTQHYKMAGNSIVVSCLYHIFKNIYGDAQPTEMTQLKLF